jgi:putative endonuclease
MLTHFRRRNAVNTREIGAAAERQARRYYVIRGYRVLDANARAAGTELDLVVRRGRRLVFVEVKQKSGEAFGDPAEMVTEEKQRRIRRAATAWLAGHPELEDLDIDFDVLAVGPRGIERLQLGF